MRGTDVSKGAEEKPLVTDGTRHTDREAKLQSHYRRLWLYSVAVTAFVSLTPLVIMTLINYDQYKKALEAEMAYPISRLVSNARRSIGDFLEERRAGLTFVARSESYEDLCDEEHLNSVFLNMKQSFGGFVDLRVIDSDDVQRAYVGRYELKGGDYKKQDWFQEVRLKGVYISDVFLGYRKFPHFVIAVREDGGDGGSFYVLEATIDMEALEHHFHLEGGRQVQHDHTPVAWLRQEDGAANRGHRSGLAVGGNAELAREGGGLSRYRGHLRRSAGASDDP